jgi:hypothetical protein
MTNAEQAAVYFRQMKETMDKRHKRYLLEQGLKAMGPLEDSEVKAGNLMILSEGGCHE